MTVPTAVASAILLAALIADAPARADALGQATPPPAVADSEAMEQHLPPVLINLVVARGDTLAALLLQAGLATADANAIVRALSPHLPPRALRPGQDLAVLPDPLDPGRARTVEIVAHATRRIVVSRGDGGAYAAEVQEVERVRHLVRAEGTIRSSLYEDMRRAGVPSALIMGLIRAFSHAVDFQRDLQPGDGFGVMFERFRTPAGDVVEHGTGLFAELRLSDRTLRIWRHAGPEGADWFDENGESVRRALLRTPLDAARISSGFGMRQHPILGYSRMHRGVDFAAPLGTPVYAAGDGTVEFAGWRGDHGRTVILRHAGGVRTLYAHLSAASVREGARVRQGQVIGRVGSTGLSTGPHLHYEVHRNTVAIDPASIRTIAGRSLQGRDLAAFRAARVRLDGQYAALARVTELALAD
ncbi:MAG: peptidoglycan DD-metalloendopeptidase family protein [Acetobacteraceae bacterium]